MYPVQGCVENLDGGINVQLAEEVGADDTRYVQDARRSEHQSYSNIGARGKDDNDPGSGGGCGGFGGGPHFIC